VVRTWTDGVRACPHVVTRDPGVAQRGQSQLAHSEGMAPKLGSF